MTKVETAGDNQSILDFIYSIEHEQMKADSLTLLSFLKKVSGEEAKMWDNGIIGFGSYHYKYKSGREGEWFLTGFSPRKQNLSIYINGGLSHHEESLKNLGKHKHSKACLYVNNLTDIDLEVLKNIISKSIRITLEKYPQN